MDRLQQQRFIDQVHAYFGERLVFASKRRKSGFSNNRMYFTFSASDTTVKMFDRTISKDEFFVVCKEWVKNNGSDEQLSYELHPVGRQMGTTKCRCCGKVLGNGGGWCSSQHNGERSLFTLSGGADHYMEHGVGLCVVTYYVPHMKVHIQFIGGQKDINWLNNWNPSPIIQRKIK